MKREIKFRYLIQDGNSIKKIIVTIEDTEKGFGIAPNIKILARGQFTGLLDNQGEEIYEGDIMKRVRQFGEDIVSVVWVEGDGKWGLQWSETLTSFATLYKDFEIIGNTYEDANLLILKVKN